MLLPIQHIDPPCCWCTTDYFNLGFIKKYNLSWCQRRKFIFPILVLNMPYFYLLTFVYPKQYREGKISFFLTVGFISFSCFVSYGSLLIIINICVTWRIIAYFHLPSFFVNFWIFCLFKVGLTVDLHTVSKPCVLRWQFIK